MATALMYTSKIAQASQAEKEMKVIEVKYGNGYSQRARDGSNNIVGKWTVTWGALSTTEMTTLTAAFDAAGGVDYFTWTPPGESTSKKWVSKKYQYVAQSGDLYDVSTTLEQVFDLD